ncbi:hypothetical protein BDR26DRAFT_396978 [Obelidium mucronatum]|nr:hypothetical protein BDR26DRAFT_396978 [Obelidium mucronatum]
MNDEDTTSGPSISDSNQEKETSQENELGETEEEPLSESSSDSEDEDEDEDNEEPVLKYHRLSGTLSDTLRKDAVSIMAVSDRFLALGTHWGVVHILDMSGNNVKRFDCHSACVNDVCIDTTGEFVASASDDGKVVINSLYTPEVFPFKHRRPVKCVALEPDYSRKPSRNHVSGGTGEELILTGKGWFSSVDTVIGSGEGAVWAVQWRNNYIAWANDAGVKLYDVIAGQKFAYIDRPAGSPRPDLFRCNLCWKDDETIMIGWADSVKIGVIKDRSNAKSAPLGGIPLAANITLPTKYVEIICEFRTDFIVSGIAPLRGQIVLLSFITHSQEDRHVDTIAESSSSNEGQANLLSNPPEIHVVDLNGDHVANDVVSLFGYEHYRANDYRLAFLPSATSPLDTTFYIVSPKDIVVAKPRDLDDHIEFLVSRARYEEALAAVESATVTKKEVDGSVYQGRMKMEDVVAIGLKYLTSLMDDGNFDQVAAMSPKILRQDPKLWEQWVYTFIGVNKLPIILPYIPFKDVRLNKAVYEMVLSRFIETDPQTFLKLIKLWPHELYNSSTVADGAEALLQNPVHANNKYLLEAAVDLCQNAKRFDRALIYGLKLRTPSILDLVVPHNLFQTLQMNAKLLMEYDMDQAINDEDILGSRLWTGKDEGFGGNDQILDESVRILRRAGLQQGVALLVENTDRAPVPSVVKELSGSRKSLHVYLDALYRFDQHEGIQYHTAQVELYADFDPTRLLGFLKSPAMYKIQPAYELCELRDLVPEMVYLLGKMGNNRKALLLVIERLGDVKQAIDFAKEQNDDELWDDLIKYSMDKPPFIVGLLENLGSHVDPIKLIRNIPEGLAIPNLQASLIKIMTDYGIQMSLREGCGKILVSDAVKLMESLYLSQKTAISFNGRELQCDLVR